MTIEKKPKVVVIGFDGAPYDYINHLRDLGKIPTISNCMEKGISGILESTIPPSSAPAWSSFLTGLNPWNHGIHDFVDQDSMKPNNSKKLQGKTVVDQLSKLGYKTIMVNMPLTSPAFKINGIMVSGFPAVQNKPDIYPPMFKDIFYKRNPDYEIDIEAHEDLADEKIYLEKIYDITKNRLDAFLYLMKNYEYDLFIGIFTTLDRFQHNYYGYSVKRSPLYDEDKKNLLMDYYSYLDEALNKIMKVMDEDAYLILLSDHGFEYVKAKIGITKIILDFYNKKERAGTQRLRNIRNYIASSKKLQVLSWKILDILPLKLTKKLKKVITYDIDSVTYTHYPFIKFNIDDEEIKKETIKDFVSYIENVKDDEDEYVIDEILYVKDVYKNESNELGDIMVFFKEGYVASRLSNSLCSPPGIILNRQSTGNHTALIALKGFYCIYNKTIESEEKTSKIIDMTPTILKIFNVENESLDGTSII